MNAVVLLRELGLRIGFGLLLEQPGQRLVAEGAILQGNAAGYGGRVDVAAEAIRLGRALAELMPDEPEVFGLLALMLCHHARQQARFAGDELVLLEDQDRSLWDAGLLEEGRALLDRALRMGGRGQYVLQAAIASLQTADSVDWPHVAPLYGELAALTDSPS